VIPFARPLGAVYAAVAAARRRQSRRPGFQRRLRRPVISVGNLAVGGRGKTPLVAHVAALLHAAGERPAVLARGYGRRSVANGVVVVGDGRRVLADLALAGDEPLMLARRLAGCAVLVAHDRHLAGVLAESRLGCTVHVLDDGFQHLGVARDLDLLLLEAADLQNGRVLPAGRLRESATAAASADAWIGDAAEVEALESLARQAGVSRVFGVRRKVGEPLWLAAGRRSGDSCVPVPRGSTALGPVLLVSGIARPERFEADVRAAGWPVADHLAFGDHHRFDRRDAQAVADRARVRGAAWAMTTEKDAVRLEPLLPLPVPVAMLPLVVTVEPAGAFERWIEQGLRVRRGVAARSSLDPRALSLGPRVASVEPRARGFDPGRPPG
jgi:tetraacyldisaccharide 4'-kinase